MKFAHSLTTPVSCRLTRLNVRSSVVIVVAVVAAYPEALCSRSVTSLLCYCVVCEVTQPRWNCGFPFLDYHWARPGRYEAVNKLEGLLDSRMPFNYRAASGSDRI